MDSHDVVSIHAPVRGATGFLEGNLVADWVSIHAPVRGATQAILAHNEEVRVSIHAPVRGATRTTGGPETRLSFQSTPPCGGRRADRRRRGILGRFNPRPRAGGDEGAD